MNSLRRLGRPSLICVVQPSLSMFTPDKAARSIRGVHEQMSIRLTDPHTHTYAWLSANLRPNLRANRRKKRRRRNPGDPALSEFETRLLLFGRGSPPNSLSRVPIENVIDRDSLTQFLSMNNNEWPDHLWVTTFFSRTSWTFYALTHFDCSYIYIYTYMKDPSDRIVFVLASRCSLSVGRFTKRAYEYIYIRVPLRPLVATRHFSPHLDGPHAVVHAIRKERTKFDCTRLTRRGQVLVVFSSERKRRPLRSRGSPVWSVTIDQLYTLGVSRRVIFLRRLLCSFSR